MSKHIELAKKLKALADRGVGGEKVNAETMLNALLKKHNLTIEEIEGEKVEEYFFKLKNDESSLLNQIIKTVNIKLVLYGEIPIKEIKKFRLAGNFFVECTASEYIEIEAKHSFYKRLHDEEYEIFYLAFCQANNLLVASSENSPKPTEKQIADYRRAQQLALKIKASSYLKQINK